MEGASNVVQKMGGDMVSVKSGKTEERMWGCGGLPQLNEKTVPSQKSEAPHTKQTTDMVGHGGQQDRTHLLASPSTCLMPHQSYRKEQKPSCAPSCQ